MEAGRSDGGSSGSMGVPCGRAWQKKGAGARCHGDSNNSAAISRKRIHGAATMTTNSSNTEKNTYLWEHAICASSQVTGLGWASVWLSRERSADRVVKRAAARL
jgi:hypothetical protein